MLSDIRENNPFLLRLYSLITLKCTEIDFFIKKYKV